MAGGREYDQTRFENLVLYLAARSENDGGYGKTKLNKLLYRADFEAYRLLGASITGEEYKRQELGPVAVHLPKLLERFGERGVMEVQEIEAGSYIRKAPTVVEGHQADTSMFSEPEMAIINRALSELRPYGGKAVSDWSHETSVGWLAKKTNAIIPYASALLSIRPLSSKAERGLWNFLFAPE